MIGFLKGKVLSLENNILLLDVSGFGLELSVTSSFVAELGEDLSIFVDTIVRDDGIHLYGFMSLTDKKLFKLLYSIKDIGPKMAQSVVDNFSLKDLRDIVVAENIPALTVVPRLGKKTAERLIFELKRKGDFLWEAITESTPRNTNIAKYTEVILTLKQLGFSGMQAENMLRQLLKNDNFKIDEYKTEDLVKLVLQQSR